MDYTISGIVIHGDGYGKKIGFPTVNLAVRLPNEKTLPRPGVYAGLAMLEGREYRAGIVVGPGERLEAHLIGYNGDAYGKEVTLHIKTFLREFKKFDTEDKLRKQIAEDLKACI